jgi:large subunit ribosomal protein L3
MKARAAVKEEILLKGILGKKLGMTHIFDAEGKIVPVSVILAGPCTVVDIRTQDRNGYTALQLGFEQLSEKRMRKPLLGQFQKNKLPLAKYLREVSIDNPESYNIGQVLKADIFSQGEKVDVIGVSKGKGFAGTMKRHRFGGGPRSHGSMIHRQPCANASTDGARTFKGQRRPGHLGAARTTALGLKVVEVDAGKNIILVRGAVPGAKDSLVIVRESVK